MAVEIWTPSPQRCQSPRLAGGPSISRPPRSDSSSCAIVAGALTAHHLKATRRTWRKCRERQAPVTAEALEGALPPYCGLLRSPDLEVLIVGVAHRDGGVSGDAARRMIAEFQPSVCLVELDQQRFSRLLACRRGLPWPYLPVRGASFQPSPQQKAMREALFSGLELAQSIVGNKDTGGGDEFYEAFLAAESCGALVLPGDVQISRALDGFSKQIRKGFLQPFQQLTAGAAAFTRAVGGFVRPSSTGQVARVLGVAMPAALVSEGGGRAVPLLRATLIGFLVANFVSLAMGGNGFQDNIEGLRRMDVEGLTDVAIALSGLAFALIGGSAFLVSFLQARDVHMASRLLQVVELIRQE
ncbi:unnamed protein product, partial [Effrenium voratum]